MIVYRVEDENQQGPYMTVGQFGVHGEASEDVESFFERCPMPKGICYDEGDLFSFESIDKLKDWFNMWERKTLKDHGFLISKILVRKSNVKFCESGKQVTFWHENAKRLKRIDPTSI